MYLPERFAGDEKAGRELIAAHPFATLVGQTAAGVVIDHLPLVFSGSDLVGHLASANPFWRELNPQSVTAIFHGPHAFVDHRWYSEPANQVPTWNYAVAHVEGPILFHHDKAKLLEILDCLQSAIAPSPSWVERTPPALLESLETSIVGFTISIRSLTTKLKLSQNRSEGDPERVMKALAATGRATDLAVSELMRKNKK